MKIGSMFADGMPRFPAWLADLAMFSLQRALGTAVAIVALGLAFAPTPATAFVCDDVDDGEGQSGAAVGSMACGLAANAPGTTATAIGNSAGAWGGREHRLGLHCRCRRDPC